MDTQPKQMTTDQNWARIAVKMSMGQQGAFDVLSAEEVALFWQPVSAWTPQMREKMKPYGGEMIAATDLDAENSPAPAK